MTDCARAVTANALQTTEIYSELKMAGSLWSHQVPPPRAVLSVVWGRGSLFAAAALRDREVRHSAYLRVLRGRLSVPQFLKEHQMFPLPRVAHGGTPFIPACGSSLALFSGRCARRNLRGKLHSK